MDFSSRLRSKKLEGVVAVELKAIPLKLLLKTLNQNLRKRGPKKIVQETMNMLTKNAVAVLNLNNEKSKPKPITVKSAVKRK